MKGICFTIWSDCKTLRRILGITEVTRELARWRLKLSEFSLDIVYYSGVKHLAKGVLFGLEIKGKYRTPWDDEVPLLEISLSSIACTPSSVKPKPETLQEAEALSVHFIPKYCTLTGITENGKTEIPVLCRFKTAQSINSNFHAAFASVRKQRHPVQCW